MQVALIGAGNMGISWGGAALLAGHDLIVIDKDRTKLEAWESGKLFEGEESCWNGIDYKRAYITNDLAYVADAEIIFIAVQTPSIVPEGSEYEVCDFSALTGLLKDLAPILKKGQILILGSTVFPGTIAKHVLPALKDCEAQFVYQPVFLRAGAGVTDFLHPPKIVLGMGPLKSWQREIGRPNDKLDKFIRSVTWNETEQSRCSYEEAEFVKLMHNTYMCLKINFANELGDLCDHFGVDPTIVTHLTFCESSAGRLLTLSHMKAGPPFSGTCLPKDSAILRGILLENLISHRCPTLALANLHNRDRIQRIYREAADHDDVNTLGMIGMGYRPGYPDARHSLAVEFFALAEGDDVGIHFWDPIFSDTDDVTLDLMVRGDAEAAELMHNLTANVDDLLETSDAIIVNMRLQPEVFAKVLDYKLSGKRVVDLYRNGLHTNG